MEGAKNASGRCAIATVSPILLMDLLLNHSDIQAPAMTALACTSTGFSKAVDEVWPSMMNEYVKSCKEAPITRKEVKQMLPEHIQRGYLSVESACSVLALGQPGRSGYRLSFAFQRPESPWTRQALMNMYTASHMYYMTTADLRRLQTYAGPFPPKYYRFEDVVTAGMLRYGRRAYVERLLRRPVREQLRDMKWSNRWDRVLQ